MLQTPFSTRDNLPRLAPSLGALLLAITMVGCGRRTEALSLTMDPVPPGAGTLRDYLRGYTDDEVAAANQIVPQRPEPEVGRPVSRQVRVRGRVYVDANRNGSLDPDEQGLPEVMVSDGEQVQRTGQQGEFSFAFPMGESPWELHHRFVFVTHPTGYRPTTQFFQRVRFDERQAEYDVDFGLTEDPPSRRERFWFLTASDPQVSNAKQMIPIAKDYAQMTGGPEKPAFFVTVGDLTSQGTHYEWDAYDFIRRAAHVPIYDGYGGHDGNGLRPRRTSNYELRIGPPYYSWDYGGVHFMHIVSEVEHLQPEVEARQERWIQADLEAIVDGTRVIVIAHEPLPEAWFDQRKAEGVNLICQLSGHFHTVMAGSRNGVPVLSSAPIGDPDWGAYGRAYRRVFVTPEGVTSEIRIAGQYQRLELVAPGPSTVLGAQPLVVVAYDSVRTVDDVALRAISPEGREQQIELEKQGDWSWHGQFSPETTGTWRFELEAVDRTGTIWRRSQEIEATTVRLAEPSPGTDFAWILAGNPPRSVAQGPEGWLYPLWVRHTGGVHVLHASPAVWRGRVYVAVPNPNAGTPGSGVLCLDARTGEEIWRAPTPMGDIPGAVTVLGGTVYAMTWEGWVAALDAETGEPRWQVPLEEEYRQGRPLAANYTMPVPTDRGLLVSQKDARPLLLDYRTGEITQLEGRISGGKYAPFISVYDGVMYPTQEEGQLAWPLMANEPLWSREDDLKSSAGIVVDGKLVLTGCCDDGTNLAKVIDAASGELTWEAPLPNPGLSLGGTLNDANPIPVVWDDLVLANGRDFAALDLKTGELRWTVESAREPEQFERAQRQVLGGHSSPLVAGSRAFWGHGDTWVRAVDHDGRVTWKYRVGTAVHTAPVVSGNLLFVHDYAGNLWCFAPARPG